MSILDYLLTRYNELNATYNKMLHQLSSKNYDEAHIDVKTKEP